MPYYDLSQYATALDNYQKALKIFQMLGYRQNIAIALNNLGGCYSSLDQYDKALDYHKKALKIREQIGNQQDIAQSLLIRYKTELIPRPYRLPSEANPIPPMSSDVTPIKVYVPVCGLSRPKFELKLSR